MGAYLGITGRPLLVDYDFEWDPKKARTNVEKHGGAFEDAVSVFGHPCTLNMYDSGHSESEDRWVTLGISRSGRLLVVCHTFNEEPGEAATIRIFSARRPTLKETRSYEEG